MNLDDMLQAMWQDYLQLNPDARKIHLLFEQHNSQVLNDHIALRTFDLEEVNLEQLAQPFCRAGYIQAGEYDFPTKHLYAQHFEHPDPQHPKIFISQLMTEALSPDNQLLIHSLIADIDPQLPSTDQFCYSGRPWELSFSEYEQLLTESEYAAWVAAFGFRPNHFTILVNALESHRTIEAVNAFLKQQGFQLNSAGGEVKGGADQYLAQSSTLANLVTVSFSDGETQIPGCYYEFALRYPLPTGQLYQGFVAASADKIFESTDSRQARDS
ncbi:DUF1338 domain-containing protein [uncultured Neptuniibacter sp.]|uniref:DUF1338 domain-containing protein n=1 Tax=uncultured Neptuniibacter sp. TaxID=502143 RepID=UPI00263002A5|nr:DUF1338 domain-containing protein [uncultured Neptuniibacter sp.]